MFVKTVFSALCGLIQSRQDGFAERVTCLSKGCLCLMTECVRLNPDSVGGRMAHERVAHLWILILAGVTRSRVQHTSFFESWEFGGVSPLEFLADS
jgi:hypothetical protein